MVAISTAPDECKRGSKLEQGLSGNGHLISYLASAEAGDGAAEPLQVKGVSVLVKFFSVEASRTTGLHLEVSAEGSSGTAAPSLRGSEAP
jgi:hypothetical protein